MYLRARWYAVETGTFLSRDPVESEQTYLYVSGNPINFVDMLGFFRCDPITGQCEAGYGLCVVQGQWQGAYVNDKPCIVNPLNVQIGNGPNWPSTENISRSVAQPSPTIINPILLRQSSDNPVDTGFFHSCMAVDFFEAPGYAEGRATDLSLGFHTGSITGEEVVYNFARMERAVFDFRDSAFIDPAIYPYTAGFTTAAAEYGTMPYYLDLQRFNSDSSLVSEYSGGAQSLSFGAGSPIKVRKVLPPSLRDKVGIGGGIVKSYSQYVEGVGFYRSSAIGVSPVLAGSVSNADYTFRPESLVRYGAKGYVSRIEIKQIKDDIMSGVDSPWSTSNFGPAWLLRHIAADTAESTWERHQFYFMYRFSAMPHPD